MKKQKTVATKIAVVTKSIDPNGKYTEEKACFVLRRAGITVGNRSIEAAQPGIKMLGAIDFLTNYCGYRVGAK